MVDDGYPLTTESSALRDIVLPPSFVNKILSVAGVAGLAKASATPFSSPIPWRKAGIKYNNNEIYFDIVEELDAIVTRYEALALIMLLEMYDHL
jgi:AP-3 complex subunit mu